MMKNHVAIAPKCGVIVHAVPSLGKVGLCSRDGPDSINQYLTPDQVAVLCGALRRCVDEVQPRPDLGAMPTPDELAQALAA